jgi:hypothetical protein
LLTRSVIGCFVVSICSSTAGVTTFGALISTPAIGPATVGLNGFELFDEPTHAAVANTIGSHSAWIRGFFIHGSLEGISFSSGRLLTEYRRER